MFKKLTVVCGLLLAATAAMAGLPWPWMEMESTPFPVGEGAHITYGRDRIWGMFPNEDSSETFVWCYDSLPGDGDTNDPNIGHWHEIDTTGSSSEIGASLHFTGMTFQWGKALYLIGAETDPDTWGRALYWYNVDSCEWDQYDIDDEDDEFTLDSGACIAYVPNPDYGPNDQREGWIYCLPGDSRDFWRYPIQPDTDFVASSIFPPNGSIIADRTPLFRWTGGSVVYRLQVSTSPLFGLGSIVMDTVVSAIQCQTQSDLADTMYYWRTGTLFLGNWQWATALSFTLESRFRKRHDIGEKVAKGAAMAYTAFDVGPSIYALAGYRDDDDATYFCRYSMGCPRFDGHL